MRNSKLKNRRALWVSIDSGFAGNKLAELEDRSRRCNLRIGGLKETSYETLETCKEHLEILFKVKLGIEEDILLERAYSHHLKTEGTNQ